MLHSYTSLDDPRNNRLMEADMQNQYQHLNHLRKFWLRRAQRDGIPLRWSGDKIEYYWWFGKTGRWVTVMSLAGAIQRHRRRMIRACIQSQC
jgi:hypothetical protein